MDRFHIDMPGDQDTEDADHGDRVVAWIAFCILSAVAFIAAILIWSFQS